jgi:hypothetical protein
MLDDGGTDAELVEASQLLGRVSQQWRRIPAQHGRGVRIKRDDNGFCVSLCGGPHERSKEALVAAVQTIEHADGQRETDPSWQLIDTADHPHLSDLNYL